jgi:uncharacterized transporter YbjL
VGNSVLIVALLKQHGVKLASLAMILIIVAAIVTIVCQYLCHFEPAIAAGLLAGALTSTPGLASLPINLAVYRLLVMVSRIRLV